MHLSQFSALLNDPRVLSLKAVCSGKAELFLVGGCVRDSLLNQPTKDLDLTCKLEPSKLLEIFNSAGLRCIETGIKHGTITVVVDQSNIEITSFRGPNDANLSIEKALEEDLKLRDFTLNAIAVSVDTARAFDPLLGIDDLNNKILRSPEPQNHIFKDDPLRVMRMIRFGPAQNFKIEDRTYSTAKSFVQELKKVSIERIQHEFSKILVSPNPRAALTMMLEMGIIELFFPEALDSVGFEQNDFHTETVFEHTLSVVENTSPDLKLRLAAFFHDLGKPHTLSTDEEGRRHFYEHEIKSTEIVNEVMPRLRYSNDLTKSVATIVKYHMRPVDCGPSGIRRLLRDLGEEFVDWRKFKEADHPPVISMEDTIVELKKFDAKVEAEYERARLEKQKKLCVTGYDLMNLGYPAGPKLGQVIKLLEEEVIEDPTCNNSEYLLRRAKELI